LEFRHILLISGTSFTDLVLTTLVIGGLKERYSEAVIVGLIPREGADLLGGDDRLGEIIVRETERGIRGFGSAVKETRKRRFDLAVVTDGTLAGGLIPLLGGISFRVGLDARAGWIYHSMAIPFADREHTAIRLLRILSTLAPHARVPRIDLRLSDEARREASRFLADRSIDPDEPFVTLAPGSCRPARCWIPERFVELTNRVLETNSIVLIGEARDRAIADRIRASIRDAEAKGTVLLDAIGESSPRRTAALIERSAVLVSNDSAALLTGIAVGTPVCGIFGPTTPRDGYDPFGKRDRVVERDLSCRPCGTDRVSECPEGHFGCMREIRTEDVFREIAGILEGVKRLGG
jgi:heptosyltransferase-2